MSGPDFNHEDEAMAQGMVACGVDEAGRGPWAGPVSAAAVILDRHCIPPGLNDSKKLTEKKREALYLQLMDCAQVGIGLASVAEIDTHNILQATYIAMQRAVAALPRQPGLVLVDGNRAPPLAHMCRTIIGGDAKCLSIAAASIIAKVTRDRLMQELHARFPDYGFSAHKGYGTEAHANALRRFGPCPEHRRSFAPIAALVAAADAASSN